MPKFRIFIKQQDGSERGGYMSAASISEVQAAVAAKGYTLVRALELHADVVAQPLGNHEMALDGPQPATTQPAHISNPLLRPCTACGHQVSKHAAACPQCGHQEGHWAGTLLGNIRWICVLLAVLCISTCVMRMHEP